VDDLARAIDEYLDLTEADQPKLPRFTLENFCRAADGRMHVEQRAFTTDQSHRIHCMCARQAGKSQGDDAILMDSGLFRPYSTNLILGFNGPHIRTNNWEPIWKRLFDRFSGLDDRWRNETRMLTTFPNGARVLMGGTDDVRHIKNILGGRIEDGVVIIDESQEQETLDELLDSTLPPMMGMKARLILSGVFPDAPVGRFWRESGWVERDGEWVQERGRGWSRHNWGRLANVHTPDARAVLDRYLEDTGLTEDDPQIQRDWFGRPAFDPAATAYRYLKGRNGYVALSPDWMGPVYASGKDERGKELMYAHEMRQDKDGAKFGMMAAEPLPGVRTFSLALDPGSNSDRASVQGWGWGEQSRIVQHVFDWTSPRAARLSTGQMFAVLGLAYRMLTRVGGRLGGVVKCRYDAGSSQNTIDNLQGDYGIPLVLAAKKTDLLGQVNRNNDMLTESRAQIMIGSALEQDYMRARWDRAALARTQRVWARLWHPDASEAARYALQDYFDAYVEPEKPPADDLERHRLEVRAALAEARKLNEPEDGESGEGWG
jgi:hypothetical protein